MSDAIINSLRESKTARWTALAMVSLTMVFSYFVCDVMAPLKPMLESTLGWDSVSYGLFTSAYGWFNVFFLMLFFGGLMLDKMGIRFTGIVSAGLMVVGAAIKYWAINEIALQGVNIQVLWWSTNLQVFSASIGFAIFGVGLEVACVTITKVIVKWFHGKELALAMGLQVATARIGTIMAMMFSERIALNFSLSTPMLLGLVLLCAGFIFYLIYVVMDLKLDRSDPRAVLTEAEDPFRMADVGMILRNKGFWLISILCVLFYSAIFPFLKYAPDLMVHKFNVDDFSLLGIRIKSGDIPALLPMGTLLLTPFFGNLYDRAGKGASMMIAGSLLLFGIHALFALPALNQVWIAFLLCILLGVSFSLVPSALWPSVAKIIPHKQLGTAYALIFWIQNWGLMGVSYLIGWALDKHCIVEQNASGANLYDYTLPMAIFSVLGIVALIIAIMLKDEDKRKGYGLESPNFQN